MDRIPVTSSNLVSVGYDGDTSALELEFKGGSLYRYDGVPQHIFDELMSAGSKGQYFHQNIRNQYPTTRI